MRKYLNGSNVPLAMAAFLAYDGYDYDDSTISATQLIKPIRQLILSSRVPPVDAAVDVSALVRSRIGSAIHDAIERVWTQHKEEALSALGLPEQVIKKVRVNPDPKTVKDDEIPVYLEQRAYKEVMGYTISGKFDLVAEGRVEDFKVTSVYAWTSGNKDEDYRLQGSLYRWLNPEIITRDEMAINFLFTDYQAARANSAPNYPPSATPQRIIPLMSIEETDWFVRKKLSQLTKYKDAPEEELPRCTDVELWRKPPVWKYYKNPEKTTRATKNFDNKQDAYLRLAKDGGKGMVVEQGGEVTACKYCPAFPVCSQKDELIAEGSLKV
jgi:hypothetical protein